MMQERPYKGAMTFEDAEAEILGQSGKMYDPRVVRAFVQGREAIRSWVSGMRGEVRAAG
jgi:response regulator RpfG family c-di-GMP phosphodiesterase